MTYHGEEFFEAVDQISTDNLHMVEIELHADIGFANLIDDRGCMLDVVEKIVWPVTPIDRLDQQCDFSGGSQIGGMCQVVDEYTVGGGALLGGDPAGEAMNRAGAHCARIVERACE